MYKNVITVILSSIFGLFLCYIAGISYYYISLDKDRPYHFKNNESLKFHKKYTKKIHHLSGVHMGRDGVNPEKFLFEMMSKLKKGGVLSISLPTDPGILFRLGRLYLKIFSIKKKYKITADQFDYMNATEHVNSIFGLHSIIKYNFCS